MIRKSHLKGFEIPATTERLLVKLFADDTTVYLSKEDKVEDLMNILDKWCKASKAKFNKQKTVIIPLGSRRYRRRLIDTKRLNPHGQPISDDITILEDGVTTRILGGQVGNMAEDDAPWTPVLEKIDKSLDNWEKGKPTMEGRKLLTRWMIGGMSLFLAIVQGMPKAVEKRLQKRIRTFMW
ncbi:hypothetical protein FISHEDRAFT_16461, partial [Fistulina hepatica ATCC 64428]